MSFPLHILEFKAIYHCKYSISYKIQKDTEPKRGGLYPYVLYIEEKRKVTINLLPHLNKKWNAVASLVIKIYMCNWLTH